MLSHTGLYMIIYTFSPLLTTSHTISLLLLDYHTTTITLRDSYEPRALCAFTCVAWDL